MTDQMTLPYKHPSNTLTTIPRALRRLTRSGRRTVTQIEAELMRQGIKGSCDAIICQTCVLAVYLTKTLGTQCVVGLETARRADASVSTALPPGLRELVRRFDRKDCPAELYESEAA